MASPTPSSSSSAKKASSAVARWVPIRDLQERHRARIMDHLLKLNQQDRYLRFGFNASADQIERYVASIDFARDEVFGIFNRQLKLVALAHLAALPGLGDPSKQVAGMEFGVSVLSEGRGKGLGSRLFQHAIMHARNRGASHMMIHALIENAPMLRIATKAGAKVERDGSEAEAWLKLPPDTVGSHIDSSFQSIAAELVYGGQFRWRQAGRHLRNLFSMA